jgi:hypothetical protein
MHHDSRGWLDVNPAPALSWDTHVLLRSPREFTLKMLDVEARDAQQITMAYLLRPVGSKE